MREIKFRAWNGQSMIMPRTNAYYQHYLSFCGNITQKNSEGMECFGGGDRWSRVEKLELMQFTGLQDKNGVDIYEGDIVQYLDEYNDEPSIHFVQYLGDKGYPAFELSPELGFECNGFAGIYQGGSGHIIVIGNIHQNPELLESKK